MEKRVSIKKYLIQKETKLKKLEEIVSFLKKIKLPLTIEKFNDGLSYYSDDYSLATGFSIKKRSGTCNIMGGSDYDGGTSYFVNDFYPQFYFNLKNKEKSVRVYIQHKNFDEDETIVFKEIEGCNGWGDRSKETKKEVNYLDIKKVSSFLRKKGVKDNLITKFENKVKEL